MRLKSKLLVTAAVSAVLLLSACDSAEERAQGHFESAVELLEAGDVERAIVEFRNVFRLNSAHIDARKLYARTMLENGNEREAYGSYTLVSEQEPNDLETRKALARLSYVARDWESYVRHATRANELAPDDPEVKILWEVKRYRDAVVDEDTATRNQIGQEMVTLVEQRPDDLMARMVVIDNLLLNQDFEKALSEVNAALEIAPDDDELLRIRLTLLVQLGEEGKVEEQLLDLVANRPDDPAAKQSLIRWYMSRGETEKTEDLLRSDALAEDADTSDRAVFVQFVAQTRGSEAALEEIAALIEKGKDVEVMRSLRAGLNFDMGDRSGAIAEMENIIATGQPSETLRDVKVSFARMLLATGDVVAARQQVEQVLAEDPTHVEALKLRAGWLIDQDTPDDAIVALRTALDQAPQDPEIMSLMARAYQRSGSRELAGEMLSLAVDASNRAPEYAVSYAEFLIEDDKLGPAEQILVDALRLAPGNIPILETLGQVYLGQADWPRLQQVEATLRRQETDQAVSSADTLRLARLRAQQRTGEAIAFLEGMAQGQDSERAAQIAIVQTYLGNNEFDAAESYVNEALADSPDDRGLKFLKAGIVAGAGRFGEAEAIYRDLLAESDQDEVIWRSLYILQARDGRFDEARATLEQGLAAIPDAPNLKWALAGELETQGDIDGAIQIYEELYAWNSNSTIIANNLASLISTYKSDEENLARAWSIARRLRGTEQPEFQDTYGWIALRRGELDEALAHLEPAAQRLPSDPLVQYHLGVAYERAGRTEEAIGQFKKSVELAGPADTRPQIQMAREEIARLESEGEPAQSE